MSDSIQRLEVTAFKVPTDFPESDGTLEWNHTTIIVVELGAGSISGLGYTYAHPCCVRLIRESLFPIVKGKCPVSNQLLWNEMTHAVRNFGSHGIAACATAAVDTALWDLKSRLLGLPLVEMLGAVRDKIAVYGSGGFTSYSHRQLQEQLAGWVSEGISMLKIKVGREPARDAERVKAAREAIGPQAELFVDANGACSPKQALKLAEQFREARVSWFEEPVSSDDLGGLRFLREHAPGCMEIAAGEYNYDLWQAFRMAQAGAVDVLQADATRCGVTGFLQTAALCEAFLLPFSAHAAPALHAHLCCAAQRVRHVEYFHDHARIEQLFFNGATTRHQQGSLVPDHSQPGLGLEFKKADAREFQIDA